MVEGAVQQAKLVRQQPPVYPAVARQDGITGVVVVKAVIAKDGTIKPVDVVSGHPLLAPAAIDAVRQWEYQPTLLNGDPVEVVTTVNVTFALPGQ